MRDARTRTRRAEEKRRVVAMQQQPARHRRGWEEGETARRGLAVAAATPPAAGEREGGGRGSTARRRLHLPAPLCPRHTPREKEEGGATPLAAIVSLDPGRGRRRRSGSEAPSSPSAARSRDDHGPPLEDLRRRAPSPSRAAADRICRRASSPATLPPTGSAPQVCADGEAGSSPHET
ncbi:hypothetical protein DAI22_05g149800 [Oryza sativa Japonica Group]|nr:hypothetical protein DAI22_05g149800 [Oryza sativa Japonica Group]